METINKIKEIQDIDPLHIAEDITGKSYKESDETTFLGFSLQMQKSKLMNELMESTDDTKFSETTKEYLRKVIDFGFKLILEEKIENAEYENDKIYILWHDDFSILLCFDSYNGSRNGGNFYYNWIPNDIQKRYGLTSTGGFKGLNWLPDFSEELEIPFNEPVRDWETNLENFKKENKIYNEKISNWRKENNLKSVWVGQHDCREAIKNTIKLLFENGEFKKNWIDIPFLWLLGYSEKTKPYEEINKSRLNKLPDYVKECIGFKND